MDPWYIDPLHIVIRLALALLLGGLIGLEREQSNHAAGFRTHILVCLGSALIMLLSIYGFNDFVNEPSVRIDPARLAAQVISGIGFLGAGTILRTGLSITGLTTAASLWVVAGIGLAVGAGFYFPAILSTVLVIISLFILNKLEKKLFQAKRTHLVNIHAFDRPGTLGEISSVLGAKNIDIRKVELEEDEGDEEHKLIYIRFSVKIPRADVLVSLVDDIRRLKGVKGVSIE